MCPCLERLLKENPALGPFFCIWLHLSPSKTRQVSKCYTERRQGKVEEWMVAILAVSAAYSQQFRDFSWNKLPTPCINNAGSRRLPISMKRGIGEYPCQQYVELATPGIIGSGESIFDYKYLRKLNSYPKSKRPRQLCTGPVLSPFL